MHILNSVRVNTALLAARFDFADRFFHTFTSPCFLILSLFQGGAQNGQRAARVLSHVFENGNGVSRVGFRKQFLFLDGSVRFLRVSTSDAIRLSIGTREGGEVGINE